MLHALSAVRKQNMFRIMIPKIHGMENLCFRCVYVRGCDVINLTFFLGGGGERLQFLS